MSFVREHVVKRLTRSSGWRKVRNAHIKQFPCCAVCYSKKGPEAHHVRSFKNMPALELDQNNLMTLCRRCHLLIGHGGYWKAINTELTKTVLFMKRIILGRVV